jgi:hypothetical protein
MQMAGVISSKESFSLEETKGTVSTRSLTLGQGRPDPAEPAPSVLLAADNHQDAHLLSSVCFWATPTPRTQNCPHYQASPVLLKKQLLGRAIERDEGG